MKSRLSFVGLLICLLCSFTGNTQISPASGEEPSEASVPGASTPGVKLIGRAYPDSVVLRWGPVSPVVWQLLNKFGYHIERYTILRDGKILPQPEYQKFTEKPLIPKPLAAWEKAAQKDKYAAIAAQAIYGKSFEITENYGNDIVQVLNASKETEQRFSFALFSADMSPETARLSALGWTDKTIRKNEKYLYKVYSAAPADVLLADTGMVYLGAMDTLSLPKPLRAGAEFSNHMALLKWNKKYHESIYIAYQVERSTDGKNFKPVSDLPLTNTEAPTGYKPEWMFKMDSLPQNGITYYYRIKGLTPFGETGPPSDVISGKGYEPLKANPAITKAEAINNDKIVLQWQFEPKAEKLLKAYKVMRAKKAEGTYGEIASSLAPSSRTFTDRQPGTVNYYKVVAVSKEGEEVASFPFFAQLLDSIPPSAPAMLSGLIDSAGSVSLSWKASPEEDVLGYRIYRSNFANREYTQLTTDPVESAKFRDHINVKTLSRNVYYKVVAVDHRHNPSVFSEVLELKRPDVLPPVPPVFKEAKATQKGISLAWHKSASEDVVQHMLYRRSAGVAGWELIALFSDSVSSYQDKGIPPGQFYEYTLLAKDEGGLESEPAKPVRSQMLKPVIRPAIKNVFSRADVREERVFLKWSYAEEGVKEFVVYRAAAEAPYSLYKTMAASESELSDTAVREGTAYKYQLKAVFADGSESGFSKEVLVNY